VAALATSGFLGATVALWVVGSPSEEAASATGTAAARRTSGDLAALEAQLAEEREAREQLARRVARLRQDVFELSMLASLGGTLSEGGLAGEVGEGVSPEPSAAAKRAEAAARERAAAHDDRPWFDREALSDLGLGDAEIEALRRRWTEHQLEKMALADRATREGWRHKLRFRKQNRALDAALVTELGSDRYDLMLYATNQPNRVIVLDVLEGSAAGVAGLQAGDRITGYAGMPVFRRSELVGVIADGEPGERVRVEVDREGRRISFDVPRGPLGIRLRAARVSPSEG
jgi:hypothetical protein